MTSHGWFDVTDLGQGIAAIAEPGHVEDVKSYLIEGDRDVAVLDTGIGIGDFTGLVASLSDRDPIVIQTHAHWDHRGASAGFSRVLVHESEAEELATDFPNAEFKPWLADEYLRGVPFPAGFDRGSVMIRGVRSTGSLSDCDRIDLGGRMLEIFHTPGHSPGSMTIFDRASRTLFPADAVNLGPIFLFEPESDLAAYRRTIGLLARLSDDADRVCPSHYAFPMEPADVRATLDAFNDVLSGRQPDRELPDRDVFDYSRFKFWIKPGSASQLAAADGGG